MRQNSINIIDIFSQILNQKRNCQFEKLKKKEIKNSDYLSVHNSSRSKQRSHKIGLHHISRTAGPWCSDLIGRHGLVVVVGRRGVGRRGGGRGGGGRGQPRLHGRLQGADTILLLHYHGLELPDLFYQVG